VTGSGLLLLFALIHAQHVTRGALVQNVAVGAKLVLLALFLIYAGTRLHARPNPEVVPFNSGAFATSLVWISFSYAGWNAAVYVGSEIRNPHRNLSRSLVAGSGIVTVAYVLVNAVFVWAAPPDAIAGQVAVAAIAARHVGGEWLAQGVTFIVMIALATSVSAMIMAGPRVYARMAEDGVLPACLRCNEGPPRPAIALQLGLALLFLWTNTFETLLGYIGFTLSVSTALTVFGLLRWKWKNPDLQVPGWPVVPVVFLVFVGWSLVFSVGGLRWGALWGAGTIALGLGAWGIHRQLRRPTGG